METDDPNNWRIEDEFPNSDISSIQPLSKRLHTIYARIPDKHNVVLTPMNIFAVILMVKGLEYHYENFKRLVEGIAFHTSSPRGKVDLVAIDKAKFEAIAYINTIGQLYYWAKDYRSTYATTITWVTEAFRHKYTGHLSIHKLMNEDTDIERALHIFAFAGGTIWNRKGDLIFQIQKKQGEAIDFNLLGEHEVILEEIQNVFQVFVNKRRA